MATEAGRVSEWRGRLTGVRDVTLPRFVPEAIRLPWQTFSLLLVLAGAGFLNLWQLTRNGYGNEYYAAAVRSMTQSWHNFFYNAFDPAGFITVDKPPVALWIEAASARVFGYSGFTILLPEALAGVGSVLLVYLAVSRVFGRTAGLIGAVALAVTPISVAINRSNNLDAWLVFFVTFSAYAVIRSLEKGSIRWLVTAAVLMGVAFNTKFLAAYIALPALWFAYLATAPVSFRRRVGDLVVATVALVLVSGAWVAAFDLTPASARPYAGGSTTNSMLNLLIDYNGLARVEGEAGPASGTPGLFRLFENALAGDASWLIPLALIGGLAALLASGLRLRGNTRLGSVIVWGGWLLTALAVFSFARGIFHDYYLSYLGPAIAALVGIGIVVFYENVHRKGSLFLLAPIAFAVTAYLEVRIIGYSNGHAWLLPTVIALTTIACAGLIAAAIEHRFAGRVAGVALATGLAALLLPPLVWSQAVMASPSNGTLPTAVQGSVDGFGGRGGGGPLNSNRGQPPNGGGIPAFGRPAGGAGNGSLPPNFSPRADGRFELPMGGGPGALGGPGGRSSISTGLLNYLEANRGGAEYLIAVQSSHEASGVIISTGEPVMAMGGFSGSDPAMTVQQLADLVEQGKLRFVLVGGSSGPGGRNTGVSQVIESVGKVVDASTYGGQSSGGTLYDLQGLANAIRSAGGS